MTDTPTQPKIIPETLAEWRKVAEAADGGLWTYHETAREIPLIYGPSSNPAISSPDVVATTRYSDRLMKNDQNNLKHIATACPTNFLALLDHIAVLKARCKAAEEERDEAVESETHAAGRFIEAHEGWKKERARADTLAAENEALREALKPFGPIHAGLEEILFGHLPDSEPAKLTVSLGDLRRAEQALGDRT